MSFQLFLFSHTYICTGFLFTEIYEQNNDKGMYFFTLRHWFSIGYTISLLFPDGCSCNKRRNTNNELVLAHCETNDTHAHTYAQRHTACWIGTKNNKVVDKLRYKLNVKKTIPPGCNSL